MDSFINLVRPWSSLPSMLKLFCTSAVSCLGAVCMYGGCFLQVFFVPFPQGPGSFPYVLLITIQFLALITVYHIVLAVLGVLVLGSDYPLLNGGTALEVCVYPIPAEDLLKAFPQSLHIGYHYLACAGFVVVSFCACVTVSVLCCLFLKVVVAVTIALLVFIN